MPGKTLVTVGGPSNLYLNLKLLSTSACFLNKLLLSIPAKALVAAKRI